MIARKAAVVDTQYKKGRIVLIGFPCQNRAHIHGTYKFLLNALLYPQAGGKLVRFGRPNAKCSTGPELSL